MAKTSEPSLAVRSARSTVMVVAVSAVALFGAAGTFRYWQAWIYLALQAISMTATNAYLLRKDPELLRRRLTYHDRGETQGVHKLFFALMQPLGMGLLVVAGLDRRFGWSAVPIEIVAVASLVVAAGMLVIFLVFRENSYASSVVEVDAQQQVISTGPYRLVRHPMYAGVLLSTAAAPLSLGSFRAEAFFPPLLAIFFMRLLAEERFLADKLPGYAAYMSKTRKRLLPWIL
jgi:protein-S-isoprenylcysteine O-methyltransferase Ste14